MQSWNLPQVSKGSSVPSKQSLCPSQKYSSLIHCPDLTHLNSLTLHLGFTLSPEIYRWHVTQKIHVYSRFLFWSCGITFQETNPVTYGCVWQNTRCFLETRQGEFWTHFTIFFFNTRRPQPARYSWQDINTTLQTQMTAVLTLLLQTFQLVLLKH